MVIDIERYLKDLEYIVNIDSGSMNIDGNRRIAEFFRYRFEKAGFDALIMEAGDIKRPLLCAKTKGCRDFDFFLNGHMDTVFPDGTAAERPFRIEDGFAYGPGTVDMKQGILLILYIAEYLAENRPDIRLCIAMNSDEEIGTEDSEKILRNLAADCKTAFIFENGRRYGKFVNERKGMAKYRIEIEGIAAHAANSTGNVVSAIVEMSKWIVKLDKLKNVDKGTTVNVGLVNGGTALNMIAPRCEAYMEVRYSDKREFARIERNLKKMSEKPFNPKAKATVTLLSREQALVLSPETERLMEKLSVFNLEYVKAGGLSDANKLAGLGIPVIDGCGPSGGYPHGDKEYLDIETVQKRYELMIKIMNYLTVQTF